MSSTNIGRSMSCIYVSSLMMWAILLFITLLVFILFGAVYLYIIPLFVILIYLTYIEVRTFPDYKEEGYLYAVWAFLPLSILGIIVIVSLQYERPFIFLASFIALSGVMLYTNRLSSKECGFLSSMFLMENKPRSDGSKKGKSHEEKTGIEISYPLIALWLSVILYIIFFSYYYIGFYGLLISTIYIYLFFKISIKEYKQIDPRQKRYIAAVILWVTFCYSAPALLIRNFSDHMQISLVLILLSFCIYYLIKYLINKNDRSSR